MSQFYIPWKQKKTSSRFLMFLGVIEVEHWLKTGQSVSSIVHDIYKSFDNHSSLQTWAAFLHVLKVSKGVFKVWFSSLKSQGVSENLQKLFEIFRKLSTKRISKGFRSM